jgi:hypothetical protein
MMRLLAILCLLLSPVASGWAIACSAHMPVVIAAPCEQTGCCCGEACICGTAERPHGDPAVPALPSSPGDQRSGTLALLLAALPPSLDGLPMFFGGRPVFPTARPAEAHNSMWASPSGRCALLCIWRT